RRICLPARTRRDKAIVRWFFCRVRARLRPDQSAHGEMPGCPCARCRDPGSTPTALACQGLRALPSHWSTWGTIADSAWSCPRFYPFSKIRLCRILVNSCISVCRCLQITEAYGELVEAAGVELE